MHPQDSRTIFIENCVQHSLAITKMYIIKVCFKTNANIWDSGYAIQKI